MIQPIQYYQPHPQLVAQTQQVPYYACTSCQLPTPERNYCVFDKNEVDYFVKQKENATAASINGVIGYTHALAEELVNLSKTN
jgi:hypothetical protein